MSTNTITAERHDWFKIRWFNKPFKMIVFSCSSCCSSFVLRSQRSSWLLTLFRAKSPRYGRNSFCNSSFVAGRPPIEEASNSSGIPSTKVKHKCMIQPFISCYKSYLYSKEIQFPFKINDHGDAADNDTMNKIEKYLRGFELWFRTWRRTYCELSFKRLSTAHFTAYWLLLSASIATAVIAFAVIAFAELFLVFENDLTKVIQNIYYKTKKSM